jgi:ABC-type transporter Mla MlaB component
MSVTAEDHESHSRIRLEGPLTLTQAAELKERLLAGLTGTKELELDLVRVTEIDIAVLQLLWAAAREAAGNGVAMVCRPSSAVAAAAREAGFPPLPDSADELWTK